MIIFDENMLTSEAAKLLANIAVVAGRVGKPRRGIIQLKPKNNSQGLADLGINKPSNEIIKGIEEGTIKGLLVFGEDIPLEYLENLEFLAVHDLYLTPTGERADVVLPAVSYAESTGSVTNSERRIQRTYTAIPPLTGYSNWEVVNEMMYILGRISRYKKIEELTEQVSKSVPEYTDLFKFKEATYWPIYGKEILYTEGFAFEDGKARLASVGEGKMFDKRISTDFVEKEFAKVVEEI
jgi:formate dehydrogenase major subunit